MTKIIKQKKQQFNSILLPLSKEALDSFPFGAYIINKNGIIECFNKVMVKMAGAEDSTKIVGLNALKLLTYKKAGLIKSFREGLKGKSFEVESVKYISYTGKKTTFRHYNGIPIKDEKGHTQKLLCIVEDITESKNIQMEVQKERDKIQKYLDIAGVMLIAIDVSGKVTLVNKKGCEILGYKEKEIIGKDWFDNFLPKYLKKDVKHVFSQLAIGKVKSVEYYENPILTKGKKEKIIAWHNTVLKDDKGKIVGTLGSGEDVTERKKAETELRESEEKYRSLFAHQMSAFAYHKIITNKQGKPVDYEFIEINKFFEGLMGLKRKNVI